MVPGGPHFTILPLTAASISETVHKVFDSDSGGFGELGFMEHLVVIEIEFPRWVTMIESRCMEETFWKQKSSKLLQGTCCHGEVRFFLSYS